MIIELIPSVKSVVLQGTTHRQVVAAERVSPGTPTPEEAEEFEEDIEEAIEEAEEIEEEIPKHRAITKLTIAIIPIIGRRNEYKHRRGIDMDDIEMYYDEGNKDEMYARIGAKLGKTKEQLVSMLFGA